MPIASIGSVVRVTPGDALQVLHGKGDYEFVEDRSPFRVRVWGTIHEDGALIGVTVFPNGEMLFVEIRKFGKILRYVQKRFPRIPTAKAVVEVLVSTVP